MKKYLFVFAVVLSLVLSVNMASACIGGVPGTKCVSSNGAIGYNNFGYGMMNNWSGGISGWGIVMMIFGMALWVVLWAVIIIAVVALVKWLYMKMYKGELWILGKKETAGDILKIRYAKGEITKEQYEVMKKEIA